MSAQPRRRDGISPHFLRDVQALALGREHGFWDHHASRKILNEHYDLELEDLPADWAPPSDPEPMPLPDLNTEDFDV